MQPFEVELRAGDFVEVTVDQERIDLAVAVRDPRGRLLVEVDSPTGRLAPERVPLVAAEAGRYRFEVRAASRFDVAHGYRLSVDGPRPAGDAERARVAAAWELARADRLFDQGDAEPLARALAVYQAARETAAAAGDEGRAALLLHREGLVHLKRGRAPEAAASFARLVEEERRLGDRRGLAAALNQLGRASRAAGDPARAAAAFDESLALWRELGDAASVAAVENNRGLLLLARGEPRQALAAYADAWPPSSARGTAGAR